MARLSKEEIEEMEKEEKTEKKKTRDVVVVPRAVSVEEMFNILSDKLDLILSELRKESD